MQPLQNFIVAVHTPDAHAKTHMSDRAVVLKAVKKNGLRDAARRPELRFASATLRADREVALGGRGKRARAHGVDRGSAEKSGCALEYDRRLAWRSTCARSSVGKRSRSGAEPAVTRSRGWRP